MIYAEMSDFEINCEVLGVTDPDVARMQLSADQKSFFHCGYDGNGFYETVIPDFCNSWADTGPIIENAEIGLVRVADGWCATNDAATYEGIYFVHINPLRAAMIVFLMMRESKKMTDREKFEAWFDPLRSQMKNNGLGSTAIERRQELQWSAWQAAAGAGDGVEGG